MNWHRVEGNWKQFRGAVEQEWGKLTDEQLDAIAGKRDHLAGTVQETSRISRNEGEAQRTSWKQRIKATDYVN